MKRNTATSLALFAAAVGVSIPSMAQTGRGLTAMPESGFYVGGTLGRAKTKDACARLGPAASCDDTDTAWRILGGYQFNRNFSTEIGYHDFGSASIPGADVRANAWEWVGIGSIPAGPVSLYAKAGLYRGESKGGGAAAGLKETNTTWTAGLGVQYDLTRQFAVRGEWQRYPKLWGSSLGGNADVDVLSVGGIFRFQ
jgi:OOP family OmpA-OmpF porin